MLRVNRILCNIPATALEFGTISSGANAGEVIQVLGATDTTTRNTTSTSYVTASNTLSVTITPSSTANKIFIIMTVNVIGGGTTRGDFTIYRGATNLAANAGGLMFPFDTDVYDQNGTTTFLDSPNTTSATTYQMYMKAPNGGTIGTYVNGNGTNSITVFEIKG